MFKRKLGVIRVVTSHQGFTRAFSIRVFITRNVVPNVQCTMFLRWVVKVMHFQIQINRSFTAKMPPSSCLVKSTKHRSISAKKRFADGTSASFPFSKKKLESLRVFFAGHPLQKSTRMRNRNQCLRCLLHFCDYRDENAKANPSPNAKDSRNFPDCLSG